MTLSASALFIVLGPAAMANAGLPVPTVLIVGDETPLITLEKYIVQPADESALDVRLYTKASLTQIQSPQLQRQSHYSTLQFKVACVPAVDPHEAASENAHHRYLLAANDWAVIESRLFVCLAALPQRQSSSQPQWGRRGN